MYSIHTFFLNPPLLLPSVIFPCRVLPPLSIYLLVLLVLILVFSPPPPTHLQALYRPNLEGEALMELACRCLRAGLERDCVSGYGIVVYLVTKQGVARTRLQGRMD